MELTPTVAALVVPHASPLSLTEEPPGLSAQEPCRLDEAGEGEGQPVCSELQSVPCPSPLPTPASSIPGTCLDKLVSL